MNDNSRRIDAAFITRDAPAMLRVMIVDDDAISLRFLQRALQELGCITVGATSLTDALAAAADAQFDLLLLDRHMPGGDGMELLAALRKRGINAPAIATSAEITGSARTQLFSAGFAALVEKPISLARLREILHPWLDDAPVPALDDAAGLAAIGGDTQALRALRTMLADELTKLCNDLGRDAIEKNALLDRLHRLRASCGFCGAPKLAAAAVALEKSLRTNADGAPEQQRIFTECCVETIAALH
jgi:two-component system OmpR family response regulator